MPSTSNLLDQTCVHVSQITLQVEGGLTIPGIFGIFRSDEDDISRFYLKIAAAESLALFQDEVTADMAIGSFMNKSTSDDSTPLETLIECLTTATTPDKSDMSLTFRLEGENQNAMTMQIRDKSHSGVVRLLWKSTFQRRSSQEASTLSLTESLVKSLHQERQSSTLLKHQIQSLQASRDNWKDTAEKLEGVWEKEKSQLLTNFLVLYNSRQTYIESLENKILVQDNKEKRYCTRLMGSRDTLASGADIDDSGVQISKPVKKRKNVHDSLL